MAGWFLFSSLLSVYNKEVFGKDHMAFPCPLLMTTIHFLAQWIFSASVCAAFPQTMGGERVTRMSWKEWALLSIPCGLITSGDIGLSNLSMVTLSLTFYTMIKASTPIFVLGWAYLFGIERITWPLVGVIMVIAFGEFLTVEGEVHFQWKGFILCLSASILSGARWTLVQLKLQTMDPPLKTTIATMRLLAPSMFFSLLLISFAIERPWEKLSGQGLEYEINALSLGLLGASLAISMILCEFYLIMHASAIILMIGGVVKELITIILGVTFFKDKLNRINMMGCSVVFLGVILYKVIFHYEKKEKQRRASEHSGPSVRYVPVDKDEEQTSSTAHGLSIEDPLESRSLELQNSPDDMRRKTSSNGTASIIREE